MTTLAKWAPQEFLEQFDDVPSFKYRDVEVVKEYSMYEEDGSWKSWPGAHKNVTSWCLLENGYAVGWNETPSVGWAFPMIKMPSK